MYKEKKAENKDTTTTTTTRRNNSFVKMKSYLDLTGIPTHFAHGLSPITFSIVHSPVFQKAVPCAIMSMW